MIINYDQGSISLGPLTYELTKSNTPRNFNEGLSDLELSRRYLEDVDIQEGTRLYGHTTMWDYSYRNDIQRTEEYLLSILKVEGDIVYMRLDRDSAIIGRPTVHQSMLRCIWHRDTSIVKCDGYIPTYHLSYFFKTEPQFIYAKQD